MIRIDFETTAQFDPRLHEDSTIAQEVSNALMVRLPDIVSAILRSSDLVDVSSSDVAVYPYVADPAAINAPAFNITLHLMWTETLATVADVLQRTLMTSIWTRLSSQTKAGLVFRINFIHGAGSATYDNLKSEREPTSWSSQRINDPSIWRPGW